MIKVKREQHKIKRVRRVGRHNSADAELRMLLAPADNRQKQISAGGVTPPPSLFPSISLPPPSHTPRAFLIILPMEAGYFEADERNDK